MNVEPPGSERERPNEKATPQRVLSKNAQRSQSENVAFSPRTLPYLPSAAEIMAAPEEHLLRVLTRSHAGSSRTALDRSLCVEVIRSGAVVVDDLHASFRLVPVPDGALDRFCVSGFGSESEPHRVLKLHARLLAMALNPFVQIDSEVPLRRRHCAGLPDLTAWDAFGRALVFECGATTGLTLLERLDEGAAWVAVLPFAGLDDPEAIRGWVFRLPDTHPVVPPSALTLRAVWRGMLAEIVGSADLSPRHGRVGGCA